MRPLFPFYGSKWRSAPLYGPPRHRVIEPFAGSAGYAVYWNAPRAVLYDADPIIAGVWRWLKATPGREILALPDLEVGQSTDDFPSLPQEARWFIGFWLNRGSAQPKKTKTAYSARTERQQLVWGQRARERVARDVEGVRDWLILGTSYDAAPVDMEATWFVDPPYQVKGQYYRYRDADYASLAGWCRSLAGQVIVCEQDGATWLPFRPLASIKSTKGRSSEVFWTPA